MQWPALSHYFGLHPWNIDDLTFDEVAAYRSALAGIEQENAKGR